jgi:hypothetical protein
MRPEERIEGLYPRAEAGLITSVTASLGDAPWWCWHHSESAGGNDDGV